MNVVAGVVGGVVPKLLQLLDDDYKLHKGLKNNVENLSKELKTIHTFLCKVSDVPWDQLDEQLKEWASDIREASYDMEDILDTFLVRVEDREPTGGSRLKLVMIKMTDLFGKWKARQDLFVPVGRNPNISKVLMDILYELHKIRFADIHTKNRDERQLIDDLREFLMDKRYFIVIDDIWETTFWEERIRLALLENNRGSRIIITTRNSQVAKEFGDEVYRMQSLSDDNSKNLFYTRIFGANVKWPDNKPDHISKRILKKCDGVPLAIITMACLLVGKPRERWSDVFTRVGFGRKDDKHVDNTMKILSFSYYDMPAYLRTCLLYLCVFPEDVVIYKNDLIWKWIAEGFIQGKPGVRLFELGEQYFSDLVNRSMVQAIDSEFNDGMMDTCRVHDMVLDLIRSISSKENFVAILDNDEGTMSAPPMTARRLALHIKTMDQTTYCNTAKMPQVRSFILNRCYLGNLFPLSTCKLLRVLDLKGCTYLRSYHLVHLGNLLHLRYLGLQSCGSIDELPNEIGRLKFLKTLNLEDTDIQQLIPSISQLTQLVCLRCDMFRTLAPTWIGKLMSLEELKISINAPTGGNTDHTRGFLKALGSLSELRVFQSEKVCEMDKSMQQDLVSSLRNLHKLQNLELHYCSGPSKQFEASWEEDFVFPQHLRVLLLNVFRFSSLPPCIGGAYLPNLTHLNLWVDHMDRKGLEFIGRLSELCCLQLSTNSTITISNIGASDDYFRKLRFFYVYSSMIQIQCEEGDSSISFHMWNGIDPMPFGSSKNNCSLAPNGMMPNLELLECNIFVRALKDSKVECGNIIGLEYLPSLQRVVVLCNCAGASTAEVDEVEAALSKATKVLPNYPKLSMGRVSKGAMISSV